MGVLIRATKTPSERRRYTINYNAFLDEDETLTDKSFSITPVTTTPLEVVSSGFSVDNKYLIIYVQGGEDGTRYELTMLVTTSDAQIKDDLIVIDVRENS